MVESLPAKALLERVKKEKTFYAQNGFIFRFARADAPRNHTQCAADCLCTNGRAADGLLAESRSKSRKRRKRRRLFVKARILAIAEPACGKSGRSSGKLWRSTVEIDKQSVQGSELRRDSLRLRI